MADTAPTPSPDDLLALLGRRPWPLVMGILNVTPDSFSDGGRYSDAAAAADAARRMVADGADVIDVGGESTRPGSQPVDDAEQVARVVPAIIALRRSGCDVPVTVDTTRAAVAAAALDAGASAVNDVSAARDDPAMLPLVAARGVPIVLMHMRGTPATMQRDPAYADVTADVSAFLLERLAAAGRAGVDPANVLFDPGYGFGKTVGHNLTLLRDLGKLVGLGRPVVVGTSRKGFVGTVTGESAESGRPFGTAATVAHAAAAGAAVVRVHDVAAMAAVVAMCRAIRGGRA